MTTKEIHNYVIEIKQKREQRKAFWRKFWDNLLNIWFCLCGVVIFIGFVWMLITTEKHLSRDKLKQTIRAEILADKIKTSRQEIYTTNAWYNQEYWSDHTNIIFPTNFYWVSNIFITVPKN